MKHKLIGRAVHKDSDRKIWHSIVCPSNDPIKVGDNLVISEDLSEYTDELIVRPCNGACDSDCWAYCHLTCSACEHILKCNHKHPRVCLVHIGELLEEL